MVIRPLSYREIHAFVTPIAAAISDCVTSRCSRMAASRLPRSVDVVSWLITIVDVAAQRTWQPSTCPLRGDHGFPREQLEAVDTFLPPGGPLASQHPMAIRFLKRK